MNAQPITITATLPAWLTYGDGITRLLDHVKKGSGQAAASMLAYYAGDMTKGERPWTRVGTAELTITLLPSDDMTTAALQSLQAELASERAESMQRQNAILERISKLQALTYEPS